MAIRNAHRRREEKEETIEINITKESESLIGRMLVRGYSSGTPFLSRELGLVGNLRNAISFLNRSDMSIESLAKVKLNKKEMQKILTLPKRRVTNYNQKLKTIIEDRIMSDKVLVVELSKYLGMDTIRLSFTAKDSEGVPFLNMYTYCKTLNELMRDKIFIKAIKDATKFKQNKLFINSKSIKGKSHYV